MDVLPITSLTEEDGLYVGAGLLNLAKLSHFDIPIAEGFVVLPPEFRLKTILEHFDFKDKEVFEQRLHIVKKDIQNIEEPEDLRKAFSKSRVDTKKLWTNLLDGWLEEIRSRIWREGFSPKLTKNLSSQPVFITGKISASGEAYYDYDRSKIILNINQGVLGGQLTGQVAQYVKKANQKLFLPQVYQWIVTGKGNLKFIKITPFTQHIEQTEENLHPQTIVIKDLRAPVREKKPITKVFLELSEDFKLAHGINGALINSERIEDFDKKVMQLVEVAASLKDGPVIYKLSDKIEKVGGVRGSLRLIHDSKGLKSDVEVFLFARHKKQLLNTQLCIPFVRSVEEFLQIKRNLASLGVNRKATLKVWLELAVPENIVHIEQYLDSGLDGVVINFDELASWIGGYDPSEPETYFYKKQVSALLEFLEPAIKILHKSQVSVVATGSLASHDDVLIFMVKKGLYALVVDYANSISIHEHLHFLEKRHAL